MLTIQILFSRDRAPETMEPTATPRLSRCTTEVLSRLFLASQLSMTAHLSTLVWRMTAAVAVLTVPLWPRLQLPHSRQHLCSKALSLQALVSRHLYKTLRHHWSCVPEISLLELLLLALHLHLPPLLPQMAVQGHCPSHTPLLSPPCTRHLQTVECQHHLYLGFRSLCLRAITQACRHPTL